MGSSSVIIASRGRAPLLHDVVLSLDHQTQPPDEIVISVADDADVLPETRVLPRVSVLVGPPGSAAQRNTAIRNLSTPVDHLVLMDDDTLLHERFIEAVGRAFDARPDVVALSGTVVLDGAARGREVSLQEGADLLEVSSPEVGQERLETRVGVYGCASAVRADVAGRVLFDERLQAYALMEDYDFGVRCARHGRVVTDEAALAVHLGVGSGRRRGLALGVAQIVNPWYLWRKGTLGLPAMLKLWAHYTAANCLRTVVRRSRSDRRGRLKGNLLGLALVAVRRGRPEEVAQFA